MRLKTSFLVFFLGGLLSLLAFLIAADKEHVLQKVKFEKLSAQQTALLQREIDRSVEVIYAMTGIFDIDENIKRHHFRQYSKNTLARHSEIQALEWIPRVKESNRQAYIDAAINDGFKDFAIKQFDKTGKLFPTEFREEYYPVYYVEPYDGNKNVLGIDLSTNAVRLAAMEKARDSGNMVTSARVNLVQGGDKDFGFLVFAPVYKQGEENVTITSRERNLSGFILGVFYIREIVNKAITNNISREVDFLIQENSANERFRFLHYFSAVSTAAPVSEWPSAIREESLVFNGKIELPNRQWNITALPSPEFYENFPSWKKWIILWGGVFLSLIIILVMNVANRREHIIASLNTQLQARSDDLAQESAEKRTAVENTEKMSSALEQAADAIIIADANGIIEYVNPAFEKLTGYSRSEAIGSKTSIVKSSRHLDQFYSKLWQTITEGKVFSDVIINRKKDGQFYYEEVTITPLKNESGEIINYISSGKDITERVQSQEKLQFLAYHDVLTKLPNRASFMERLNKAVSIGNSRFRDRFAVLFVDLDEFKRINDSLGHDVGDQLLKEIPLRIEHCIRSSDTLARIGGDEFAILLQDITGANDVRRVVENIVIAMEKPFLIGDHTLFSGLSIGISIFPDDGKDSQTLLKSADLAMYRVKDKGKNNYQFYSEDMSVNAYERLGMETSLRGALGNKEFYLVYQPVVDLETEQFCGFEALLRWRSEKYGEVPPETFIPLLEESGLISSVGEWVIDTACEEGSVLKQKLNWTRFRMAVNLSAQQFSKPGLCDQVLFALAKNQLAAEMLELEITESVLLHDHPATHEIFKTLSENGVCFSVDDFGTGYSSLSYLKKFPISRLKIDSSFVFEINQNADDAAIVRATIAMAKSLNMSVTAEGVETLEQMKILREYGCQEVQGFLYSMALTLDELLDLHEIDTNKLPAYQN